MAPSSLTLTEFRPSFGVPLTEPQRDALRRLVPSISVAPSIGRSGAYDLTPGSWIGVADLPDLQLVVRPKIPIDRVLFLVSYAMDPRTWWHSPANLGNDASLVEAVIPGFVFQVKRALRRGLKQGYRTREESLLTIRGRLRVQDQITRRFGVAPPAEVTFDDFTEDIELNRLIRAGLRRLERLPVRDDRVRWPLRALDARLANVSISQYDPRHVPMPTYTRLTEHYRPAVELARLILRSQGFELEHGPVGAAAFMLDMNAVFEDFMVVALREALGASARTFVQGSAGHAFHLDEARLVPLRPDLSWWEGSRCRFVGDLKYKTLSDVGYVNADLYQVATYVRAAGLTEGLLIYASGPEDVLHTVVNAGPRLRVVSVDLGKPPETILAQVRWIAGLIKRSLAAA